VLYCTSGVYFAPTADYVTTWATRYNGCAPFPTLAGSTRAPRTSALCPPDSSGGSDSGSVNLDSGSELLRIYTTGGADSGCASPMAIFWVSELKYPGHAWPRAMPAAGGLDGTGVTLQFFANVRRAMSEEGAAAAVSADVFFPLVTRFSPCVADAGHGGPCADAAPERPPPTTAGCF
jgi:hypothetical protein